ncbi:MAG: hypothetical protein NT002_10025 [candidate division Zixibacteria bacterium]|nr:hypothetical protein [candidate division Zixibacteria bacterium]
MSKLMAGCMIAFFAIFSSNVVAQISSINSGANWLVTNQDISGFWGVNKQTPFRDAAVVVDALNALDADSIVINNGLNAISSTRTSSNDYLARKIMATASAREGSVPAYLVDSLANMQSADGGWGYQKNYAGNNLETALSLRALRATLYSNMTKLGQGVNFLTSDQNADSGWAFVSGDSSRVFYTAHALIALTAYAGDFSLAVPIRRGVNWLRTQPHPDGGFGTGAVSNPYETGLALAALIKGGYTGSEVTNAISYLETSQLPDGSWNEDAYSTAKAIYGLNYVGPDLAISASDIVLSKPAPVDSDIVTITATIRNRGVLAASNILVQIFDGNPTLGGVQIGTDATIASLAPGASSIVQVTWNTLHLAGDHNIYVVIDPANTIREPEKLNNTSLKTIHVYFPPDLVMTYNCITFDPAEPEIIDEVAVIATVWNTGEVAATGVPIDFWDGDPQAGGIPLLSSPYIISSIAPGSKFTLNLNMGNYFSIEGNYVIYACADINNVIREISEFNNCNNDTLRVGLQSRSYPLNAGLTLLGLPLTPLSALSSYLMIPQISLCNEIDGWDRVNQRWISAVDIGGGVIIGEEFPIALRDGFFARVTGSSSAGFLGRRATVHECTDLQQGLNIVSVPNEDACYTAYSLIDDINSCVEAHHWDPLLQMWVSAAEIAEDVFIGEDFSVTPGNGYFVKANQTSQWCTHTCDTIPIPKLPDLLVTTNDIMFSQNPATAGVPVGIYVNINNIGTDTARTPRLDIYLGDPHAGGTRMASGNIPVDIPPGGSSDFYGSTFTFGGSGVAQIYGIADLANTIAELDETNNEASKPLTINPAILAVGETVRSIEPLSALAFDAAGLSKPIPVSISRKAFASGAASVSRLKVGNLSSSSAVIAWCTDGITSGSVNYGTSTSLGLTKFETTVPGSMHTVTLSNLSENTTYYFEISLPGVIDNNNGRFYSFTTTKVGAGKPFILYGQVIRKSTGDSVSNAQVSAALKRNAEFSFALLATTNNKGGWMLNLGNLKSAVSNGVELFGTGDTVLLEFLADSNYSAVDTIVVADMSPQNCKVSELERFALCGDIDGSGVINLSDITRLIVWLYKGGSSIPPVTLEVGDVDCSGVINIRDIVSLIRFVYRNGSAPCAGC